MLNLRKCCHPIFVFALFQPLKTNSFNVSFDEMTETIYGAYWQVRSIVVDVGNGEPRTVEPAWFIAPLKFSYHCDAPPMTSWVDKAKKNPKPTVSVSFITVQAEGWLPKPAKSGDVKFSYPCDCVGFFTSAIWSGLVVSVIYLVIIALGITMLVNLETMDRFEDPKGQQLKIQASG